jgi:hypothetical protein
MTYDYSAIKNQVESDEFIQMYSAEFILISKNRPNKLDEFIYTSERKPYRKHKNKNNLI